MKNAVKLWSLGLALIATFAITSCDENETSAPNPFEVGFNSTTASLTEDGEDLEVTIDFGTPATTASTFEVALSGTAMYDTDYTTIPAATNGVISIPVAEGDESKMITITPNDNDAIEDNKTIIFTLTSDDELLTIGTNNVMTISMVEDDKPIISLATLTFEEVDIFTVNGNPAEFYNMRYIDRDELNVTQDPRDDANGQGRLLVSTDSINRKVAVVTLGSVEQTNDLGFSSFYYDPFENGNGLAGWRRLGVMSEVDQRTTNPDVHPRHSDGFIWGDQNPFGSGWNIVPDHDGEKAFRMSHIDGKVRLVIEAVDLLNYENVSVKFRLTTVRAEEYSIPKEGNENKPVELDIFAAINVPEQPSELTGEGVLDGAIRLPLLSREGAGMVPDGVVYPDDASQAPSNSADYFLIEDFEFNISEQFAIVNADASLSNVSLVVDFQTPGREPTCIYVDNIEFTGSEK